jgi:hypothetical protein
MSTDILKDWPASWVFEAQLARMGVLVVAGGELDSLLKRYSAARAALTHARLAAASNTIGYAVAAVAEEMTPREAARVARETYEDLRKVLG